MANKELENRQEQLKQDMKTCGLREFNDLYMENLMVQKQLENFHNGEQKNG